MSTVYDFEAHTITGPNGYPVKPLIVFDTTNACFEIENENDAAEVGRVMSALKQADATVELKRVDFVADITDAVFRRMESERKRVANEQRSQAQAESEKIRAEIGRAHV